MKRIPLLVISVMLLSGCGKIAERITNRFIPGFSNSFETVTGTVSKIYAAETNGFVFRAYVVDWNGQEIVISDPLGQSSKSVGDSVSFMAQSMAMRIGATTNKMLNFTILQN